MGLPFFLQCERKSLTVVNRKNRKRKRPQKGHGQGRLLLDKSQGLTKELKVKGLLLCLRWQDSPTMLELWYRGIESTFRVHVTRL